MSTSGTHPEGSVLGVDAGTVRVGFAVSDETRTLATPLLVLRRDDPRFWARVDDLVRQRGARTVVVGLPRRPDGAEGDATRMARAFADDVARRTGCMVELWDERFTSQQAERSLIEGGMRRDRRKLRVDAVAAALMLQSWLDRRRHSTST